ncbi:dihydroxyacetone kinase subunit DhaK, partial [Streptococcus agalactiae]
GLSLTTSMATLGVASKSATILGQHQPVFDLEEGYISFGIGIHGEPGYRTMPFVSMEHLANELVNKLKMKLRWQDGEAFILLINNLGGSSKMEELLFTNAVMEFLALDDLQLPFIKTGHLITSLDMAGLSVTLCRVKDSRWIDYLKHKTDARAW